MTEYIFPKLSKYSISYVVVSVRRSRERIELCAIIQFAVELQFLLRLYRPILDRLALLQLSQVNRELSRNFSNDDGDATVAT